LREGDCGGGAEESGGAGWDGPGTWREPEAEEELIIGGIDSEAATNEDEGSKDETSVLGRRLRRAQSIMTPAKKGMLMSSALADGRNMEGGGALENGKASMISALRLRSRPMRCNCAERDSSAPAKAGSNRERRAWMAHFQLNYVGWTWSVRAALYFFKFILRT